MRSRPMLASVAVRAALILTLVAAAAGCASKTSSPGGGVGSPAKELDSPDIASGTDFSHRFSTAGTFGYHCKYHAVMTGSVDVNASAVDSVVTVTISTSTGPFPAASVKPGGTVTWHNGTAMTHTVTSN